LKNNFLKVWKILNRYERRSLIFSVVIQFFSGITDLIGVVSVIPFLTVAANPEILHSNDILLEIMTWTGLSSEKFIMLLGLLSLVVLVLNQVIRLGSTWYMSVVTHKIWLQLHERLFSYYLYQPYLYHVHNSSNKLLEKLQVRVNATVAGVITPVFKIIGSVISTILVLMGLIIVEAKVSLILFGIVFIFYVLVYKKIKNKVNYYGQISPYFSSKSFKLITEALSGIKEVKVRGSEQFYLDLYDPLAKLYINARIKSNLFTTMPGGAVEIMAFGGLLVITLIMISTNNGFLQAVPLLGMFALALKRIIPAMQDIYTQITEIEYYKPSFEVIYNDLADALFLSKSNNDSTSFQKAKSIFNHDIKLQNISFTYPNTSKQIIKSITMTIPYGSTVGIVGTSGSGKTTLADIILGIIKPDSGTIMLGSEIISSNSSMVKECNVGYVPQMGLILDDTILNNIAFSVPEEMIDMQRVKEVAKIAGLSDFIDSKLQFGYKTNVGDRGLALSGGQRQRLSIARSLYFNPEVLIFDESTSALDSITENQIMDNISNMSNNVTIIMIAHRLTTLMNCDTIFLIEKGKLADSGTYTDLIKNNSFFRKMAKLNK
jgi:ATP-binding cassette, subfamily B, bacterial PglK